MQLQINIDDAMRVTVSRPCESCGVMVPTDEHCGDTLPDGTDQYLCPDCYGQRSIDQKFTHNWLIFLDEAHPLECGPIAIHKDVVGRHWNDADCSTPDPEDGVTRFGPGSFVLSLDHIDNLFFDVTHVYTLMDEGLIDGQKAHTIFKAQGGAK